jgi:hypothetical protein
MAHCFQVDRLEHMGLAVVYERRRQLLLRAVAQSCLGCRGEEVVDQVHH